MIIDDESAQLPKKLCWKTYLKMGSGQGFKITSEDLAKQGWINPKTNKPYTRANVRYRAYQYALDYETRADARKDYAEVWKRVRGTDLTEEEWILWLIAQAKSIYYQRPRSFRKWVQGNGFQKYTRV